MENKNTKLHPAWIGVVLTIIVYTVIISAFAFTTSTKTQRNEEDIIDLKKIHTEDIKDIRKDQMEFAEKVYFQLTELRKDIAEIK